MSLWSRIFSSPKIVDKAVDAAISAGDALFFTDEEKSKANLELLQLKIEFAKATTGSRLARRVLAFMFSGVFLFLVLLAVLFGLLGKTEAANYAMGTAKDTLATPIAVILGFYFATQLVRK